MIPIPLQFLFVVAIPLVVIAGGLVTLFLLGALLDALENQKAWSQRIEALFRRPPRPPKTPGEEHYYKPHWKAP